MKNPIALQIQKVSNGYIVRDYCDGNYSSRELAVFNDVIDMCRWITKNFSLAEEEQPK